MYLNVSGNHLYNHSVLPKTSSKHRSTHSSSVRVRYRNRSSPSSSAVLLLYCSEFSSLGYPLKRWDIASPTPSTSGKQIFQSINKPILNHNQHPPSPPLPHPLSTISILPFPPPPPFFTNSKTFPPLPTPHSHTKPAQKNNFPLSHHSHLSENLRGVHVVPRPENQKEIRE